MEKFSNDEIKNTMLIEYSPNVSVNTIIAAATTPKKKLNQLQQQFCQKTRLGAL